MKTFNKIMKATKEDMRHMHCGDPTRLIAVTRGQILYSKPDDLIMRSCWVKIELQYNCHPQFERGEIVFTPLIQPSDQPKTSVAANSRFLSQLTDRLHEFGGETIIFPPYAEPELQINDPENGQIIRSTKDTTITNLSFYAGSDSPQEMSPNLSSTTPIVSRHLSRRFGLGRRDVSYTWISPKTGSLPKTAPWSSNT